MTESKEIVKATSVVEPATVEGSEERLVVVAKNPEELHQSQQKLIEWAKAKLAAERKFHSELEENYQLAVERKWRSAPIKRHVAVQQKRVEFYEKIQAALEAGYYIIPNIPLGLFAIRTVRKNVRQHTFERDWGWPTVPDQKTNAPPLGDGRYVSPEAQLAHTTYKNEKNETRHVTTAIDWREVDFPFLTIAKPEVVQATDAAMSKLIFDEMGVSPPEAVRSARADPMIVGKIVRYEAAFRREVSFLVAWFLDTDDL